LQEYNKLNINSELSLVKKSLRKIILGEKISQNVLSLSLSFGLFLAKFEGNGAIFVGHTVFSQFHVIFFSRRKQ